MEVPLARFPVLAQRLTRVFPAVLAICAIAGARQPASGQAPAGAAGAEAAVGRVVEIEVPAPSLEGNLLGTATVQGAAVYLPPGYDRQPARRYPAIYLLHGIFDRYPVWIEHFRLPEILDRSIGRGAIPPLVVVMPNGGNRFGGGFYRNSTVAGNWGDFVADDLVGFVDREFRTLARRESRAVAGHSMGGYGAIHLTMTRPEVFSVAWAMSPCCLAAEGDFGFGNDAWRRAYLFESPEEPPAALEAGDFYPVAALGVLAAFHPDPANPPFFVDFPFDLVRGEIVLDDEEYDRYLDALPLRRAAAARDALRSLAGLALDVGLGDQFLHIPTGTLALSRTLGELRIPHLLDVYDGDHRQRVSERLERVVLPWVAERLAVAE